MPQKSRFISSAVAAAIMLSALTSCGQAADDSGIKPQETSAETGVIETAAETEASLIDQIPAADYGGYEFRILGDTVSSWWIISLDADELNGEIINDTVYERNRFVESKMNISISLQQTDQAMSLVGKSVQAGSNDYDMVWERINVLIPSAQNGYLVNLNSIGSITYDPRWWDTDSVDAFTINGKLFFACNDINVHTVEGCSSMFFSKTLIDANSLENPYELVRSEKWTIDKMGEMMKTAAADSNGDGVRNEGDTFGLVTGIGQYLSLVNGTGERLVYKQSDGSEDQFVLNLASDKMIDVTDKVASLLNDKNLSVIVNDDSWGYKSFYSDHSLFYIMQLGSVAGMRDSMENDFGILPFPMYSESQGYYITSMEATAQAMCVPSSVPDPVMVGAVTEAMSMYSDAYLYEAYYDTTLKGKIARDVDTTEMLDILTGRRAFDYATCYGSWGIYEKYLNNVRKKGASELTSLQAKTIDKFNQNVQKTIDAYAGL